MEHDSRSEWVAERLAATKPEWHPNANWARTRLSARIGQRPVRLGWATAALTTAVMLTLVAALPQSRAIGQDLWYRLFFRSFDAVRLDLSRIPLSVSSSTNGAAPTMVTLAEAEWKAGYKPMLPPLDLVGDWPAEVTVTGPVVVRQVIQVQELQAALARAGAHEVQVPPEWQGVNLRIDLGSIVIAGFKDDVQVVQAEPIQLHFPAGFPLVKFAETAFRCAGVPAWKAREMGERFVKNPAWLLDVPEDEVVNIEEIPLQVGRGLLVDEPVESGGSRVTILFGTSDRIFSISSGSREQSIRIANSLL